MHSFPRCRSLQLMWRMQATLWCYSAANISSAAVPLPRDGTFYFGLVVLSLHRVREGPRAARCQVGRHQPQTTPARLDKKKQ